MQSQNRPPAGPQKKGGQTKDLALVARPMDLMHNPQGVRTKSENENKGHYQAGRRPSPGGESRTVRKKKPRPGKCAGQARAEVRVWVELDNDIPRSAHERVEQQLGRICCEAEVRGVLAAEARQAIDALVRRAAVAKQPKKAAPQAAPKVQVRRTAAWYVEQALAAFS